MPQTDCTRLRKRSSDELVRPTIVPPRIPQATEVQIKMKATASKRLIMLRVCGRVVSIVKYFLIQSTYFGGSSRTFRTPLVAARTNAVGARSSGNSAEIICATLIVPE